MHHAPFHHVATFLGPYSGYPVPDIVWLNNDGIVVDNNRTGSQVLVIYST